MDFSKAFVYVCKDISISDPVILFQNFLSCNSAHVTRRYVTINVKNNKELSKIIHIFIIKLVVGT